MEFFSNCPYIEEKENTAGRLAKEATLKLQTQELNKMNAIWLETTGCSGNILSLMNSDNPGLYEVITEMVNLTFSNSVMASEGEFAYDIFLQTLETDFILIVDGAITTVSDGAYTIVANYKGRAITALEAVTLAGEKAKYVLTVGTCASYGGISAAAPNPAGCKSVADTLKRPVIRLPGCPCHPDWLVGTLAHLLLFGEPLLDEDRRPILFYGVTIHDNCTRRGFFDSGIFAKKFGEPGCMIQIGCKGPVTKTDCPRRKWNSYVNWPIGDNTNCIGCANPKFPDGMEPFVRYQTGTQL